MDVNAYMANGIWRINCPKCSSTLSVDPTMATIICFVCYPDLRANMLQAPAGNWTFVDASGQPTTADKATAMIPPALGGWLNVPDLARQQSAKDQANTDGAVYNIIFPPDRGEIEAVLRVRDPINMGWNPGETVSDLATENTSAGLASGLES